MAFGHWMERDVFPRAWDWCSYGRKRKEYTSERAVTHSKVVCVCVCVLYHIHSFKKLGTFQVSHQDSVLL